MTTSDDNTDERRKALRVIQAQLNSSAKLDPESLRVLLEHQRLLVAMESRSLPLRPETCDTLVEHLNRATCTDAENITVPVTALQEVVRASESARGNAPEPQYVSKDEERCTQDAIDGEPADEFKPCPTPWCHNPQPILCLSAEGAHYVWCGSICKAEGPRCETRAEAIAAWNTRPVEDELRAEVERLREAIACYEELLPEHEVERLREALDTIRAEAEDNRIAAIADDALTAQSMEVSEDTVNRCTFVCTKEGRCWRHHPKTCGCPVHRGHEGGGAVAPSSEVERLREALRPFAEDDCPRVPPCGVCAWCLARAAMEVS